MITNREIDSLCDECGHYAIASSWQPHRYEAYDMVRIINTDRLDVKGNPLNGRRGIIDCILSDYTEVSVRIHGQEHYDFPIKDIEWIGHVTVDFYRDIFDGTVKCL